MDYLSILYIDPGTGGMLFTILFGIFGVAVFSVRALVLKMKYRISGGKSAKISDQKLPIAIFTDHKRYWNVFEPLLDEFENRKQKVVYLTCSKDDPVFDKKYEYITGEFIGEGNKASSRLNLLNASVVVSSTPSLGVNGSAPGMLTVISTSFMPQTMSPCTACSAPIILTRSFCQANIRKKKSDRWRRCAA